MLDLDGIHADVAQASYLNRVGVEVVVVFDAGQDPLPTLAHILGQVLGGYELLELLKVGWGVTLKDDD